MLKNIEDFMTKHDELITNIVIVTSIVGWVILVSSVIYYHVSNGIY